MTLRNVTLKLGLITVPVGIESAVADTAPKTNLLCVAGHEPTKIRQPRFCPACKKSPGKEVRGIEVDGGWTILDESAAEATKPPPDIKDTITLTVHPAEQVATTTLPASKVYHLAPKDVGVPTYALVRHLVASRPDLAFVAEFAVRSVGALYRLTVHNGSLVIGELCWPETMRVFAPVTVEPDEAMRPLAEQLVEGMVTDFDVNTYHDRRAAILEQMLDGAHVTPAGDTGPVTGSPDQLLAALKEAVA